ncbi:hypothetical protein QVD99_000831 [Batrachochytrium dendrobatidis]|nr:hypothetical protein QVD99_000831 [Batrachochytrium dendrobatidis]
MYSQETVERINKVVAWSKRALHLGFIPLIIYLGFTRTFPKPSLLKIISPLAG